MSIIALFVGTATGKRIMKGRELVAVEQILGTGMVGVVGTGAAPALPDLVAGCLQNALVSGVLPLHHFLDDLEQPLTFLFLRFLGGKQVGIGGRVVHHL